MTLADRDGQTVEFVAVTSVSPNGSNISAEVENPNLRVYATLTDPPLGSPALLHTAGVVGNRITLVLPRAIDLGPPYTSAVYRFVVIDISTGRRVFKPGPNNLPIELIDADANNGELTL